MTEKAPKNNSTNLETIKLMLAYLCITDVGGLVNQVEILDRFDLTDAEKAKVCKVREQSVRDARRKIKKGKK